MSIFIPIDYDGRIYPVDISPKIKEVSANFDVPYIRPLKEYSLHTEYSYGKRKFDTNLISSFSTIKESHKDFVPKLWVSKKWAEEFGEFIIKLVGNNRAPKIIEIHPPFNDYYNLNDFIEIYKVFEKGISDTYPDTEILIENRYGTLYRGGKFLVSNVTDLEKLCESINKNGLKLRVVLDVIQIFSSYNLGPGKFNTEKISSVIRSIYPIREMIKGVHLWGKKDYGSGRFVSHMGDLNTYFIQKNLKDIFLGELYNLLDDGNPRYFVPEVNSSDLDLRDIIEDLKEKGFKFV
ncbi:MAG TPA: hypothetical protein PLI06_05010 [Methanofastidiosum sp.]|nr:hypothetical protein [Methanofastidiosum sp.]